MLRSEIKLVVLGKRIELIRTDNPSADLKLGVDVAAYPARP